MSKKKVKRKKFKRENSHKKTQTPESWRKPKGRHSNARLQKKHAASLPKAGYRTDKEIRGTHPSGYEDIIVNNTSDLEELDEETEAARIASAVGDKKREQIIEKADEEGIKVLNRGDQ